MLEPSDRPCEAFQHICLNVAIWEGLMHDEVKKPTNISGQTALNDYSVHTLRFFRDREPCKGTGHMT